MAARVELTVSKAPLRGAVSAADADEEAMFALLSEVADRCPHLDLRTHASGVLATADVAAALDALREVLDTVVSHGGSPWAARWTSVLLDLVTVAKASGADLAWTTTYDQGGSVDDGPLEFRTAAELIA